MRIIDISSIGDWEPLVFDNDFISAIIKADEIQSHFLRFSVYEVISWDCDNSAPIEVEQYLSGTIKWDGCSHIDFGDNGYIHLCGNNAWELHNKIMSATYAFAKKAIIDFDEEASS